MSVFWKFDVDCAGLYSCFAAAGCQESTRVVDTPPSADLPCYRVVQHVLTKSLLTLDSELKFYTLPEFTPASKLRIRDANSCCVDLYREGTTEDGGVLVTVLTRTTILRIRVEKEAKRIKVLLVLSS
jgi:hypothetical protein